MNLNMSYKAPPGAGKGQKEEAGQVVSVDDGE